MQLNGNPDQPHTPRRSVRTGRGLPPDTTALGPVDSAATEKAVVASGAPARPRISRPVGRSRKSPTRRPTNTAATPTSLPETAPESPAASAFDQSDPEDLRRMELLSRLNQIERQRRELTRSSAVSFGAVSVPGRDPVEVPLLPGSVPAPSYNSSKRKRPVVPSDTFVTKRRKSDPVRPTRGPTRTDLDVAPNILPRAPAAIVSSLPADSRAARQSGPPRHSPAVSARAQTTARPPPTPILDLAATGSVRQPSTADGKPRASARALSAPMSPTSCELNASLGRFTASGSPPSSPGGRSGRVRTPSVLLSKQPGEAPPTLYGAAGKSVTKNNQVSYCLRIVKDMLRLKDAFAFAKPIDKLWPRDQLPGYFEMISHPMDLSTIQDNLETGNYLRDSPDSAPASTPQIFETTKYAHDMRLVFDNARTYNRPGDIFYEAATRLSDKFEAKFAKLPSFKDPASASSKKKKKKDAGGASAGGASASSRKESKRRKASARAAVARGEGGGSRAGGARGGGSSGGNGRGAVSPSGKSKSRRQSTASHGAGGSGTGGARNGDSEISASSKDPSKMSWSEMEERLDALKRQLSIVDARSPSPSPTSGGASYLKQAQALYHVPMSFEEKVRLSENVGQLPGDKLQKLVALISKNTSSTMEVNNEEEIELDINDMDHKTLRDMEAFVNQTLFKRKSGGRNGSSPRVGELAHLTRDQLRDQIEKLSAVLGSASRDRDGSASGEQGGDGHGLKKQKSFLDDSDSSSDSDSSGSSSGSGSSGSSDSSDDDSSGDDSEGDEKRKRRERNLEHMRRMGQTASHPGSGGTPLPSPGYGGTRSSVHPDLYRGSTSPQAAAASAPVNEPQSPMSPS